MLITKGKVEIERSGVPLKLHVAQFLRGMRGVADGYKRIQTKVLNPAVNRLRKAEKALSDTLGSVSTLKDSASDNKDLESGLKDELRKIQDQVDILKSKLVEARANIRRGEDVKRWEDVEEQTTTSLSALEKLESILKKNINDVENARYDVMRSLDDMGEILKSRMASDAERGLALASAVFTGADKANYRSFVGGANQIISFSIEDILKRNTPAVRKQFKARVKESQKLITSLNPNAHKRFQNSVNKYMKGKSVNIRQDVAGFIDATKLRTNETLDNRAQLIAIDQMHTYASSLQEIRSKEIGITHYIWRDSGDGDVRPEHHKRNGKRFSYDEPPPGGHPGQDIACRCTAEPDISTIFTNKEQPKAKEIAPVAPVAPLPKSVNPLEVVDLPKYDEERAIENVFEWPDIKDTEYAEMTEFIDDGVLNPIKFDEEALVYDIPANKIRKSLVIKVKTNQLHSVQLTVNPEVVTEKILGADNNSSDVPLAILTPEGRYVLIDGNHRSAAKLAQGYEYTDVRVYEIPKEKKVSSVVPVPESLGVRFKKAVINAPEPKPGDPSYDWNETLNGDQADAFTDWGTTDYDPIRRIQQAGFDLKTHNKMFPEDYNVMSAAEFKGYKKESEAIEGALKSAPDYQDTAFRGISIHPDIAERVFIEGASITNDALSSWSKDETIAEGFAAGIQGTVDLDEIATNTQVILRTKLPKGFKDITATGPAAGGQQELLLERGKRLNIIKVERKGNKLIVDLEPPNVVDEIKKKQENLFILERNYASLKFNGMRAKAKRTKTQINALQKEIKGLQDA